MISISNLSLQRGLKPLFHQASVTLYPQHKIGIIGKNGVGKTSLFSLILGNIQPDNGTIECANNLKIATVEQEIRHSDLLLIDYVIAGYKAFYPLYVEMKQALNGDYVENYAEKQLKFDELGGYSIEAEAAKLLDGLGFSQDQLSQRVSELSGGWQIRLNLAQALLKPSDVLLLDEPTNHLDIDALVWLEKWLKNYEGMILLISHDRYFLDQVVKEILLIEDQQFKLYSGHFSRFEKLRAQEVQLQAKQYEKQQKQIAHLQSFIDRFKAQATKAKQAQSRVKMLEKMQTVQAVQSHQAFSFEFPQSKKLSGPLLKMEHAKLGYDKDVILSDVNIHIVSGMRVGLLGKNGAGKSTLIKSIVGDIPLISGIKTCHDQVQMGYFAQHALDAFDEDTTPMEYLKHIDSEASDQKLRNFLGRFLFSNEMAYAQVRQFSGGEKARLVLASLVYLNPNVLILDEPTNHLDMEMRQALNQALQFYEGALILVSHDRYLLEATVDSYWLVYDSTVQPYEGDLDQYKQLILASTKEDKQQRKQANTSVNKTTKKQQRTQRAETREKLKAYKNAVNRLEQQHQALTEQLSDMEQTLAQTSDPDELSTLSLQYQSVKEQAESVEMEWMAALEAYEAYAVSE